MDLKAIRFQRKHSGGLSTDYTTVTFPIKDILPTDPYILKGAENLAAADQNVILGYSYGAETAIQNINVNAKEIILRVGLNPQYVLNQTVEMLRNNLYRYMSPALERRIILTALGTGLNEFYYIDGYISKIEGELFSTSNDVYITVKCASPFFRRIPYAISNPTMTTIAANEYIPVNPQGTAFNTFKLLFRPAQPSVTSFEIYSNTNDGRLKFSKATALYTSNSQDHFFINTDQTSPEVTRILGGYESPPQTKENLINHLTFDSEFFVLPYGPSSIKVDLPNAYFLRTVEITEYYWGL